MERIRGAGPWRGGMLDESGGEVRVENGVVSRGPGSVCTAVIGSDVFWAGP